MIDYETNETLKFKTSFVNKYGIAMACDVYPKLLISDSEKIKIEDYKDISSGDIVYVISSALKDWFIKIYPDLLESQKKIILVTGDSVKSSPINSLGISEKKFIELKKQKIIYHWFCQNIDVSVSDYVTPIPLGIDFHTIHQKRYWREYKTHYVLQDLFLNKISFKRFTDFYKRKYSLFCDIHHNLENSHKDRRIAYEKTLNLDNVNFLKEKVSRNNFWKKMRNAKFIISPRGFGLDCHRTWEALALGVVPIIKTSKLDNLFVNLPVLIVNSYSEINNNLLNFYNLPKNYNLKSLTLTYWLDLIYRKKRDLKSNLETKISLNKDFKELSSINLFRNFIKVFLNNIKSHPLLILILIENLVKKYLLPYSLLSFIKKTIIRIINLPLP